MASVITLMLLPWLHFRTPAGQPWNPVGGSRRFYISQSMGNQDKNFTVARLSMLVRGSVA